MNPSSSLCKKILHKQKLMDMLQLANRSGKNSSPTPASLSSSDRLDANAFLATTAASAPTTPLAAPVASTSRISPAPATGGLAKRRPGPGMSLSGMGAGAPNGRVTANGPAAGGAGGGLAPPGKRGPPGGGMKLNQSDMAGGTPFSNFAKIVCVP